MAGSARNAQIIAAPNGHFITKGLQGLSLRRRRHGPFVCIRIRVCVSFSACKLKVQILTFKTMCQAHLWLFRPAVMSLLPLNQQNSRAGNKTDACRTTAADKDEPEPEPEPWHMCIGHNFN